VACLLDAAGLALIAIGASPAAIIFQLALAIACAVASLRVREYPWLEALRARWR
jgi:hypothetical protein